MRAILRLRHYGRRWVLTYKGTPDSDTRYKSRKEFENRVKLSKDKMLVFFIWKGLRGTMPKPTPPINSLIFFNLNIKQILNFLKQLFEYGFNFHLSVQKIIDSSRYKSLIAIVLSAI